MLPPCRCTKTTHVWNIDTEGEHTDVPAGGDQEYRGFRARWKKRSSAELAENDTDSQELQSGPDIARDAFDGLLKGVEPQEMAGLAVVDAAADDLLNEVVVKPDGLGQLSSHNKRQAISNTDMGVFKFPWEKGRLAKIFGNEPAVKLKVPKLQPSSRNLLQMSVHVDATGSLTAKPVLQDDTHSASRPMFLDVVKSTADVAEPVDRDEKRTQALKAWWTLLAHDLTSSAVGRKVHGGGQL